MGGGDIAARKAGLLQRAGADVRVIAPALGQGVRGLVDAGALQAEARAFEDADLRGVRLVVAATDDRVLNRRIAALARGAGLLVNVVDDPDACSFVMPSIIDRDPVLVAVSTAGASPVLARILRGRIEALLPTGLGTLATLLGSKRAEVKRRLPDVEHRRRFWERMLDGPLADAAAADDSDAAEAMLAEALTAEQPGMTAQLAHVRAPGDDPDALTFRMARLMQRAQTVVHDSDVPEAILDRCRRDAGRRAVDPGEDPTTVLAPLAAPGTRLCWLTLGRQRDGVEAALGTLAGRGVEVLRG